MRTTPRLLQLLPLLALGPGLVLLQAATSSAFLVPSPARSTVRSKPVVFSSTVPTTPSAATQQKPPPQQQQLPQQQRRVRFEGFSPEEGAAAGDTITVVYDPRAPGLDAPIPLPLAEDYDFEEDPDSLLQDTDREAAMDDNDDDDDPQFTGSTAAAKAPCLLFGFDGWDGSARPFVTPLFPGEEAGTWAASVHLPNYARRLDCAVSDGDLAFDTNGGAYYHLLVTHVQRLSADGVTVETYRQAADGVLTPTGVLEVNDAQELERMIEEELDQRHRGGGNGGAEAFAADVAGLPLLGQEDEDAAEEEPDLVDTAPALASESFGGGEEARRLAASGATGVPLSAQAAERAGSIQQLRAEAGVVGERVGLSSIMINEVREAFDGAQEEGGTPLAYEGLGAAVLGMEAAGRALAQLGLDGFGAVEVEALCARVLGREGPVSLEGLMRLFQALDEEDCGISMV